MKQVKTEYNFNGVVLKADHEEKTVSLGDLVYSSPFFIGDSLEPVFSLWEMVEDGAILEGEGVFTVRRNRAFTEAAGITPSKFRGVWNSVMLSVWVDPIKEQVYRYAFKSRLPNPTGGVTLERLWSNIDLVRQCEEDGNHHIVPFVLALEKAPQDLKRAFGKGLWKQLCKNSLSRNRDLSRHWGGVVYFDVKRPFSEPSRVILRTLNKYPSRALKWKELGIVGGTGLWAARCSGFHKWGFEEFLRLRHIAQDTSRMASMLGEPFSLKWGAEEMVERHERYTAMQLSGEYSKEPFKVLEDFPLKEWHGEGGWSAHLLMSPYEVAEEGRAMRHCVAGYGGAVKSGSYLVYSFRKDGERRSTLGVKKCLKGGGLQCTGFIWDIDQHYGFANEILPTEELAMGRCLLAELGGRGLEHYEEPEERRVA